MLAVASHASIILVDFGDANSSTLPAGWNSSVTTSGITNLADNTGSATAFDIAFTGDISDSGTTGHLGTRTQTPSWSDAGNNVFDDRLWVNAGGSGTMVLSDLDTNLLYDIELFSSYAAGSGGRGSATFTMTDASGAVEGFNSFTAVSRGTTVSWATNLEGANAEEGWLGWSNMSPDINGQIILSVSVPSSGDDINPRGALNAMQISTSPVPEPSTYAALAGALALGLVVLRRQR
jgi:hypothetical protein